MRNGAPYVDLSPGDAHGPLPRWMADAVLSFALGCLLCLSNAFVRTSRTCSVQSGLFKTGPR